MRVLVAITGASGAVFALDFLRRCPGEKYLVVSDWGRALLADELSIKPKDLERYVTATFKDTDLAAPFASGSNRYDAFVVIPCSASTLSKISYGIGDTLITRAAQVALKERMRLILALRETPLSIGMLESALRVSREGGIVMPISPPFYNRPGDLDAMVRGFTDKLLTLIGADTGPGWRAERLHPSGDQVKQGKRVRGADHDLELAAFTAPDGESAIQGESGILGESATRGESARYSESAAEARSETGSASVADVETDTDAGDGDLDGDIDSDVDGDIDGELNGVSDSDHDDDGDDEIEDAGDDDSSVTGAHPGAPTHPDDFADEDLLTSLKAEFGDEIPWWDKARGRISGKATEPDSDGPPRRSPDRARGHRGDREPRRTEPGHDRSRRRDEPPYGVRRDRPRDGDDNRPRDRSGPRRDRDERPFRGGPPRSRDDRPFRGGPPRSRDDRPSSPGGTRRPSAPGGRGPDRPPGRRPARPSDRGPSSRGGGERDSGGRGPSRPPGRGPGRPSGRGPGGPPRGRGGPRRDHGDRRSGREGDR